MAALLERLSPASRYALVIVTLAYLLMLGGGGDSLSGALVIAAVWSVAAAATVIQKWGRIALKRATVLAGPGAAMAVLAVVVIWSMTPFIPGGVHPAWTYVQGAQGAATLNVGSTMARMVALAGLVCTFAVGFALGRRDHPARFACTGLICGGVAYGLLSLVLFGQDLHPGARMTATLPSPNIAATLFAALAVLSIGFALSATRRPGRKLNSPLYWSAAGLFTICLLLTASRGGVVAAAAGVIALLTLEALAGRVHRRASIAIGAGALVLVAVEGASLLARTAGPAVSTEFRGQMFSLYWKGFLASPLFGYGLGAFDETNRLLLTPAVFEAAWDVGSAHNLYLQWLLETGLFGALPMFAAVALVIAGTWRGLDRRRRSTTLIRALLAVDAVFLVHSWTDFTLQVPAMAAFFALVLGLQFGLAHGSSDHR